MSNSVNSIGIQRLDETGPSSVTLRCIMPRHSMCLVTVPI